MANYLPDNPNSIADYILRNLSRHKQFVLSTVDANGNPWAVCLNLSFDHDIHFIWKSQKDTEHSQHLKERPQVSLCVFSEDKMRGDFGFYAKAIAHEVTDEKELLHCLDVRYTQKGKVVPPVSDFLGDSLSRIYLAVITKAWVNDDSHIKTAVELGLLRMRSS